MVDWVIAAARELGPDRLVVVTSPETQDAIAGDGITVALQPEARGTGDAAAAAQPALEGFEGDILVLSGDSPLLTPELLTQRDLGADRGARYAVKSSHCEVSLDYDWGEPALSR